MNQDDITKEEQNNCNGPLNIPENETILSENEEEIDPFEPECIVQIKGDCDFDVNQENSAETVNEIHLSKHIESVHDGIKKKFKCAICDYETMNKTHLKRHIESVHEGIKSFKCRLCDFKTAQKSDLNFHIESVHEGLKPFKCNICNYETAYKSELKKHIIQSNHEREKPVKCAICDGTFEEKIKLQKHLKVAHDKKVPLDSL